MKDRDIEVLNKILDHASKILDYSSTCKSYDEFADSGIIVDACVFNIMQIGELAKSELSDETKQQIKAIPWNNIYGMRNRIVHGYSYVDMKIIWETICDNIPELKKEITETLSQL